MALGWIDFSKTERSKILNVLDLLSESDTTDELGISPVRDGFANLFFPGTSTIQTRAKYFFIVPYALKDLELNDNIADPKQMLKTLDDIEKKCAEILIKSSSDKEGIIGNRAINNGRWLKRTPSDIYWSGLKNYQIMKEQISLTEYLRSVCAVKLTRKSNMLHRKKKEESSESDDHDAGDSIDLQFWNIPYYKDWMDNLQMKLTREESSFLKDRIIKSHPDSMMAFIIKNKSQVLNLNSFHELGKIINLFPDEIQKDYELAIKFSCFIYVLRIVYNIIVSDGKNETANDEWLKVSDKLGHYADLNIDLIFNRLQISGKGRLHDFLCNEKKWMIENNIESLKNEIIKRESEIKGKSRARTCHPGQFETNGWFCGGLQHYRFLNAKTIIKDIFDSEGTDA